jgi:hypothetical protein
MDENKPIDMVELVHKICGIEPYDPKKDVMSPAYVPLDYFGNQIGTGD